MEDTLLKVLNIPIATSGNPLGEYTHINNIIGPAIGVGGTIYNLVTLKSTNFHHRPARWSGPCPAPSWRNSQGRIPLLLSPFLPLALAEDLT